MARRGQALAVPLITAALAVSALAGGWALFRQGSPRVTTPPDTVSQIYVLTDDPGARIEIGLQLTLNFGEIYDAATRSSSSSVRTGWSGSRERSRHSSSAPPGGTRSATR